MGRYKADDTERMKLYNAGLTDEEIAEREFVTGKAIFAWRKSRGIKPNKKEAPDNGSDRIPGSDS